MELINNIVKGLAKVFQFFLQFLAGEEDTALHGAQREVQLFSDFAVLEAGNVHSERNSIFFRERVDYPMHFFQVVRSFRTFKAGVLWQVQMIKIIGLLTISWWLLPFLRKRWSCMRQREKRRFVSAHGWLV